MNPNPSTLKFRVSQVDCFRAWLEDEDADMGWLLNRLRGGEETEEMRKGTAFHRALEFAAEREVSAVTQDGYTFVFDGDFTLALPSLRELRGAKDYGGIEVSGQVDAVCGNVIFDHKTTERFDAERYYRGYQWRYYLDIFRADRFRWNVFEMHEAEPAIYQVTALHTLEQTRYPGMEDDCRRLARALKAFAETYGVTPAPVPEPKPAPKERTYVPLDDGPLFDENGDLLPATHVPAPRHTPRFRPPARKRA